MEGTAVAPANTPAAAAAPAVAAAASTEGTAPVAAPAGEQAAAAPASGSTAAACNPRPAAPAAAARAAGGPEGGKKRPANPGEGHGDAKRRRADFSMGDRGVFFTTTTPGGAGNARRDLVRLLEDALSQGAGSAGGAQDTEGRGTASVGSQLEAELQELKTTKPSFVLCGHEVAKGTGFLKFAGPAASQTPSEVVAKLLQTQRDEFQATRMAPSSRLLCRVLPIDYTCKPFVDDFRKLAQEVLPQHVGPDAEPTVWALEFRARNTNTLKKEAVLGIIDDIVPKGKHRVNLSDPKKCILVEVNPLFCGLSILPQWAALKKYNLHALTTPDEVKKPPGGPKSSPPLAPPAAAAVPAAAAAAPAAQAAGAAAAAPATDGVAAPAPQAAGNEVAGSAPAAVALAEAAPVVGGGAAGQAPQAGAPAGGSEVPVPSTGVAVVAAPGGEGPHGATA